MMISELKPEPRFSLEIQTSQEDQELESGDPLPNIRFNRRFKQDQDQAMHVLKAHNIYQTAAWTSLSPRNMPVIYQSMGQGAEIHQPTLGQISPNSQLLSDYPKSFDQYVIETANEVCLQKQLSESSQSPKQPPSPEHKNLIDKIRKKKFLLTMTLD